MDFSYSRLSTYRRCAQQYNWHYVQKIESEKFKKINTLRGLMLHEFAEDQELNPDLSFVTAIQNFELNNDSRLPREEKEKMKLGADRIKKLFEEYIKPKQDKGYQLFVEQEFVLDFHGHQYIAKLDVILLKRGSAIIIDYKTGQSTKMEYYKEQMALYKMALSESYTIPDEDISTYICFLLLPEGNRTLKSFLKEAKVYHTQALATLTEIETTPKTMACLNRMCGYCEYRKMCDLAIICNIK